MNAVSFFLDHIDNIRCVFISAGQWQGEAVGVNTRFSSNLYQFDGTHGIILSLILPLRKQHTETITFLEKNLSFYTTPTIASTIPATTSIQKNYHAPTIKFLKHFAYQISSTRIEYQAFMHGFNVDLQFCLTTTFTMELNTYTHNQNSHHF